MLHIFRCPYCHSPIEEDVLFEKAPCLVCGGVVEQVDGIPLLVKDRLAVESNIQAAKQQGREAWFTDNQARQLTGPYRHHLKKRKDFVESAINDYLEHKDAENAVGLDLGCGDGNNLFWLSDSIKTLYGSDYNLLRLKRANALGPDFALFMADINDYPVVDGVFDIIFFNHVLEHISNDMGALSEVYRILRPGGLLILGVPNEGAAFWQLAYRLQPKILASSDHIHHYTAVSIADRCQKVGFHVKDVCPIGWGVPHWWLDAVIRRFKLIDDGLEYFGRRFLPDQATSLYLLLTK